MRISLKNEYREDACFEEVLKRVWTWDDRRDGILTDLDDLVELRYRRVKTKKSLFGSLRYSSARRAINKRTIERLMRRLEEGATKGSALPAELELEPELEIEQNVERRTTNSNDKLDFLATTPTTVQLNLIHGRDSFSVCLLALSLLAHYPLSLPA